MNRLKYLIFFAIIAFVAYYFFLRPNYDWKTTKVSEASQNNWLLIDSASSRLTLNPVRWIKPLIDNLTFISPRDVARINDSLIASHVIVLHTDNGEQDDEIISSLVICDCKNSIEYLFSNPNDFDLETLRGKTHESARISVKNYLCPKNKSYYLIDYRGREVDVSHLILRGDYIAPDLSDGRYVRKFVAVSPYEPNMSDESALRSAMRNANFETDSENSLSWVDTNDSLYKYLFYTKSDSVLSADGIQVRDLYNFHLPNLNQDKKIEFVFLGERDLNGVFSGFHSWALVGEDNMVVGITN